MFHFGKLDLKQCLTFNLFPKQSIYVSVCPNFLVLLDQLDLCIATQITEEACSDLCHHSPFAMCQMDVRTSSLLHFNGALLCCPGDSSSLMMAYSFQWAAGLSTLNSRYYNEGFFSHRQMFYSTKRDARLLCTLYIHCNLETKATKATANILKSETLSRTSLQEQKFKKCMWL